MAENSDRALLLPALTFNALDLLMPESSIAAWSGSGSIVGRMGYPMD